jgi:RNAse (barnase) inhibitor barstar
MRTYRLDCHDIKTADDFWELYVRAIAPEGTTHFGRNLDAFNDALSGGPGWPGACVIELTNWANLEAINAGAFLSALRDIASSQSNVHFVWADV